MYKNDHFLMEENISFERILYEEGKPTPINDIEFLIDRIIMFPKIRPHSLERAVSLCLEYCSILEFRVQLLEKINESEVLIYQLYKRSVFVFDEIEPFLINRKSFLLCYYFREHIDDFVSFIAKKDKPYGLDESFLENMNDIYLLFEYGFHPSSIEYCLKYDVIDDLVDLDNFKEECQWSPFEWSYKPKHLDLLSFSGFFGSIKCFKHFLMKGFSINNNVLSMIVCSGCFDLFHLYEGEGIFGNEVLCKASEFCHLSLLVFIVENGGCINGKDIFVYLIYLI